MKLIRIITTIYIITVLSLTNSAYSELLDNEDGTITDTDTGLMWQQEDDNIKRNWKFAVTYCENLNVSPSTYSDWWLPNIKELRSIIDNSQFDPAIDSTAFPNTNSSHYWSSSTVFYNPVLAEIVNFSNGNYSSYDKANSYYVRCVRGGQ
jgi:hypothetical protein